MSETCPGCGDDLRERIKLLLDAKPPQGLGVWARTAASRLSECLQQLAQRDERIKELEARALRMERALRTIEAWPFNIMGDCVADARALARKALEEE